jgi:hypothetical protein
MPSLLNSTNIVDSNGQDSTIRGGHAKAQTRCLKPLVNSGSLDKFAHRDLTPVIGREFDDGLQVRDLVKADPQLINDLAVTSQS